MTITGVDRFVDDPAHVARVRGEVVCPFLGRLADAYLAPPRRRALPVWLRRIGSSTVD